MATAVGAEEYKCKYEALILEKNKMEADFGQKRAQFRQLYLDVEGQVKQEKELTKKLEVQVKELTRKNLDLKSEIEGVRTASQLNTEEQTESIKSAHQEEIASLQHIYQEHAKENQARLAAQFEEERNKLVETIRQLESRMKDESKTGSSSTTVLLDPQQQQQQQQQGRIMSSLSNTFKKASTAGQTLSKAGKTQDGKTVDVKDASLDTSLQQAQKDIDAWKAVVEPLENEIKSLKGQLEEAKKLHESIVSDQDVQEMKKVVESERSARTDLEMYVAVLNTQKGVLQEDTDKLKRELHNVCRLFEQEKMSHAELKQTWKLANEQFLDQQTNLFYELEHAKKHLSPQQLEQLSKTVRRQKMSSPDTSQTAPEGPILQLKQHQLQKQQQQQQQQQQQRRQQQKIKSQRELLGEFDMSPSTSRSSQRKSSSTPSSSSTQAKQSEKQPSIADSLLNTFFPTAAQAKHFDEHFNDYMQDVSTVEKPLVLSSSSESDSEDDLNQAIRAQNQQRYQENTKESSSLVDETGLEVTETVDGDLHLQQPVAVPSVTPATPTIHSPPPQGEDGKKQLKKSNSSGDILSPALSPEPLQEKSLSQGDVSLLSDNTPKKTLAEQVDSKMSLNETGWSTMSDNVYSHACMMCQNYEKQLQLVQKELVAIQEKENYLAGNMEAVQVDLSSEKEKFASLERSIESTHLDTKSQINIYKTNQQEVDKQVNILHSQFKRFQDAIVKEIKALSEERDRTFAKMSQKENSSTTDIEMTETEKEEEFKTEIMFLKDRMLAVQVDREAIESVLQGDLKEARDTIEHLQHEVDKLRRHPAQQQQQQQQRQDEDPPLLSL